MTIFAVQIRYGDMTWWCKSVCSREWSLAVAVSKLLLYGNLRKLGLTGF